MAKKREFDIFDEIGRMHYEMERMFSRFFESSGPLLGFSHEIKGFPDARMPVSHAYETESSVIATFELPGVDTEDINLVVGDNSIEVSVKSKKEKEIKKKHSYSYSASANVYYREVPLPAVVIPEKASADYKNGVLRVEIPKKKAAEIKEKKTKIKVR